MHCCVNVILNNNLTDIWHFTKLESADIFQNSLENGDVTTKPKKSTRYLYTGKYTKICFCTLYNRKN